VRAALNAGNMEAAADALQKILDWHPEGFAGDRSLLLTGQGFARGKDTARARELFAEFEQRYPESPLLPQVRLAIARTYEQERNWTGAVAQYDAWMGSFTNAADRARAEFSRAWGYSLAGQQTNALPLFTNFVVQFPAHELAARAQWWVADYYFDQGDYQNAERNYQLVFNNTSWPVSRLTYQARLMAGRAAVARLRPQDAIVYFTNLTSDLKCPPELRAEALMFYGDARVLESTETNKVENLQEAIRIFGSIPQLFPTNHLVPGAWGRIGECHLQLAETDGAHFQSASNAFQRAIDLPQADISVRSRAKVLLGTVAERQAQQKTGVEQSGLLRIALDHYLDVVYSDKLLRDNETEDLFWTKRAGLDALRLAETLEMWEQAMRLCERLQTLLPPLHANFEKRKLKLQEQLARKS
jgi:TolA-binding protein